MKEIVITIVCSVLASSGMWALFGQIISKKMSTNDASARMLKGLAHDRILYLGNQYIKRGYITPSEYENLVVYLYEPYAALHGNGTAEKVVNEVKELPFCEVNQNET